jgi:hypothetical protein
MYSNKELKKLLAEKLKELQKKQKESFTGMGIPPLPGFGLEAYAKTALGDENALIEEISTTLAVSYLMKFVCLCTLLFIVLHYVPQTKNLGSKKIYFITCGTLVTIILFFKFIYLPKETRISIFKWVKEDSKKDNAFTYASILLMIWRCMFYLHLFLLPALLLT